MDMFDPKIRVASVSTSTPKKKTEFVNLLDFSGSVDVTNRVFGNQYEDREIVVTMNILANNFSDFSFLYDKLLHFIYYPTDVLDVFIASKQKSYRGIVIDGISEDIVAYSSEVTFTIKASPLESLEIYEPLWNNFDELNWRYGYDQIHTFWKSGKFSDRPGSGILKAGTVTYNDYYIDSNAKQISFLFNEELTTLWTKITVEVNDGVPYEIPMNGEADLKLPASLFVTGNRNKLTFVISGTDHADSVAKIETRQLIEAL